MATDDVTLDALRQRVTDIDRQLISLVAERKRVSGEVARVKRATGYPTRDFEREREVILGVRTIATIVSASKQTTNTALGQTSTRPSASGTP